MDLQKRKPTRLKKYDYSTPEMYFITICVKDKKKLLSNIIVGDGVLDVPLSAKLTYTAHITALPCKERIKPQVCHAC